MTFRMTSSSSQDSSEIAFMNSMRSGSLLMLSPSISLSSTNFSVSISNSSRMANSDESCEEDEVILNVIEDPEQYNAVVEFYAELEMCIRDSFRIMLHPIKNKITANKTGTAGN